MKGQTQAVTAVLITGIIIAGIASVYVWGIPLIEKREEVAEVGSLESSMTSIKSSIESVANSGRGSSSEIGVDLGDGGVEVNSSENYIEFTAFANGATYPRQGWTLLGENNRQGLSIGKGIYGYEGEEEAGKIAARRLPGEGSVVRYRIEYRNMRTTTPSGPELRLIDLEASGANRASEDVMLRISNQGTESDTGNNGVDVDGKKIDRVRTVVSVNLR